MTSPEATTIRQTAAQAAREVPGVVALQPSITDLLAGAASRLWPAPAAQDHPPEAGIRATRALDPPGWYVEVRCVLSGGRRVLDVAREVRDQVRTSLAALLTEDGTSQPVTVTVAVTSVGDRPRPMAATD